MTVSVHPTATVETGASIGDGSSVWHQAHVRTEASIGDGCTLGKNVFVDRGVQIGHRVKIQNNVSVYAGVTLGDDVFVGPSAVFTNDLHPRAFNTSWTLSLTEVERGASIGANATIVCGVRIGSLALVGSGAVVVRDVAPHQLVIGNPARHAGWVCTCGRTMPHAAAIPSSPSDDRPDDDAVCLACGQRWQRPLESWSTT